MKKSTLVLLLGILLLITTCNKKSASPEEKSPQDYVLQTSQTIGSEGGTITTSDFSLSIPAGAFTSSETLKLYASSKDKPFGDSSITRTFKLEGVPDEYSQPLKMCIKYEGTISNQGYIAAGGMTTIPGSDELKPTFSLFPAIDSSGYLWVELPAMEKSPFPFLGRSGKLNAGDDLTSEVVTLVGVGYYDPPRVTPHFKIYCPSSLSDTWKYVLTQAVELAYDSLKALGFNLSLVPWPVNVYTLHFLGDDTTRHCIFSPIYGTFNLIANDGPMFSGQQEYLLLIKAAIIRELAHAIFCTYDKEYFNVLLFHTVKINPQHYWLHHAVASWCEEKVRSTVPLDYSNDKAMPFYAPFRGMQTGAKDDLKSSLYHGAGMSSLIEYLTLNYRESVLLRIYDGIKTHLHPVEAIMNGVQEEACQWWPDFFKEYVEGHVYGPSIPQCCNLHPEVLTDTFSINSKNDTYFISGGDYPDLSAKIYRIGLNYADIDTIKLVVGNSSAESEDIMIMVFRGNGIVYWLAQANQQVNIPDVDSLIKYGNDLFVVVVNSSFKSPQYTSTSSIDLEVKVVSNIKMDYNWCRVELGLTDLHFAFQDTGEFWEQRWIACEAEGSFKGNTFEASWFEINDPLDPAKITSGSMTVVIEPVRVDSFRVVSFSVYKASNWPQGGHPVTFEMTGSNITFNEYDDYYNLFLRCKVTGLEACAHIGSLEYEYRQEATNYREEIIGYQCNSESDLRVVFWEWHGE